MTQKPKFGPLSVNVVMASARRALARFPFVILCSVATAICLIRLGPNWQETELIRLAGSLALGIPLFLSARLFMESKGWIKPRARVIEFLTGAAVLALHYLLTRHDQSINYPIRYFHLSLTLHLLVSFVAFFRTGEENSFWQFNRWIFQRILLSILYATVFFTGVAIAFLAISTLFAFRIPGERFFELWIISVFALQTWHFLAGIPSLADVKNDMSYPKELKIFVQFMLIPLVSLYILIMYLYMYMILSTREWPSGYISWLVSVISVLGIFNLLLLHPEKNRVENRWIAAYTKLYYVLILPLLGLLFVAVGKRISAYGLTELRYFLVVLGMLLTALSLYFLFSRAKNIKVIPISLFVLALVALWGPVSAYDVALRSQKGRAREIMERNGLLNGQTAKPTQAKVSSDDQRELGAAFQYILRNHGSAELRGWFPPEVIEKTRRNELTGYEVMEKHQTPNALMEHLGLIYDPSPRYRNRIRDHFNVQSDLAKVSFDLAGFERAAKFSIHSYDGSVAPTQRGVKYKDQTLTVRFDKPKGVLVISEGQRELMTLSIMEKLKELNVSGRNVTLDEILIEGSGGGLTIRFLCGSISGYYDGSGLSITGVEGVFLLKGTIEN